MANQQLVDYIKSQLAAGVTKTDLQKAIATAGWSQQDTSEAFGVVEGKTSVAPPVTPAAPAQPKPVQQPVQPQATQPVRPVAPIAQPVAQQPAANLNLGGPMRASTMQMNVQAGESRRHTTLWITLAVIVLLIAGSAAAYMYVPAVQEVVGYYLSGGKTPAQPTSTYSTVPPVTTATTSAQGPMIPASTTPATSSTSYGGGTSVVATTSATTSIVH